MPCTIEDTYGYRSPSGSLVGIPNATIYAVPSSPNLTVLYGTDWRPLNGINPQVSGDLALRYAAVEQTDATGAWSFDLPYADGETHPSTPKAKWTLLFPDGSQLYGEVPAVPGPLSVDELIATYSWQWTNRIYVSPVTPGTFAKGTATFAGGSATAAVVFLSPFAANTYQVVLTPSVDVNDGSIPKPGWSSKTTTGFVINVDSSSFEGSVDWEAQL